MPGAVGSLYPADCSTACMQLQGGSKVSTDTQKLLTLYLEFLDRNVSALLVYCNKSVLLLLGLRVLKHAIARSTKEEEMSPLLHRQISGAAERAPACLARGLHWS